MYAYACVHMHVVTQVSELEILGGLSGLHPASSPVFLVHLARALEAMTALRRLGLSCGAPHTDGLAQVRVCGV